MPTLVVPNSATLHTARAFLEGNAPFRGRAKKALLQLHPRWLHVEPIALVMIAAWGAWCRRHGYRISVRHQGPHAAYMARMKLFEHLGVDYDARPVTEREEAGRFLPVTQVLRKEDVPVVIGNISALLHLQDDAESLSAVQYCVSELLRNVLEHSGSQDGVSWPLIATRRRGPTALQSPSLTAAAESRTTLGRFTPKRLPMIAQRSAWPCGPA